MLVVDCRVTPAMVWERRDFPYHLLMWEDHVRENPLFRRMRAYIAHVYVPFNAKSGPFEWLYHGVSVPLRDWWALTGTRWVVSFSLHSQQQFTFLQLFGNYDVTYVVIVTFFYITSKAEKKIVWKLASSSIVTCSPTTQQAPYMAAEQLWIPYTNIERCLNEGVNHCKYYVYGFPIQIYGKLQCAIT